MSEKRAAWKAVFLAFGSWTIHFLATLVVAICLIAAVPQHIKAFEMFNMDLPAATVLTIHLSDFAVNYWYLFSVPLAIDGMLLLVLNLAPPKFSWLARVWSTLFLVCSILLLGFILLTVSLPIESLARGAAPSAAGSGDQTSETEGPAIEQVRVENERPQEE